MTSPRYLSTAVVSRALGVSVTTVKRWVDEGVLPAHKTAGGHRKILLRDVLCLIHQQRLPCADLSLLTANESVSFNKPEDVSARLFTALTEGDGEAVRKLLVGAHRAGIPIEQLADRVICPAMKRIGHGWAEGNLDVYEEHLGTQLILAALHTLRASVETSQEMDRPIAIGGCPEGDHYLLASLISEILLQDNGWEAINLGPNLPLASLRQAMNDCKPRLIWLSVSHLPDNAAFLHDFRELARAAERARVPIVVGGQALTQELREQMPYAQFGTGLTHLAEVARGLHPRTEKPRRGRPLQEK